MPLSARQYLLLEVSMALPSCRQWKNMTKLKMFGSNASGCKWFGGILFVFSKKSITSEFLGAFWPLCHQLSRFSVCDWWILRFCYLLEFFFLLFIALFINLQGRPLCGMSNGTI